jgi:hypothetical protein
MAELVDALGSGPSDGNIVEVRVFFRAPNTQKIAQAVFFVCWLASAQDGSRKIDTLLK